MKEYREKGSKHLLNPNFMKLIWFLMRTVCVSTLKSGTPYERFRPGIGRVSEWSEWMGVDGNGWNR